MEDADLIEMRWETEIMYQHEDKNENESEEEKKNKKKKNVDFFPPT